MKKIFKGISMLLVLAMCMSFGITAFAYGNLTSVDESMRGNVDASIHKVQVASIDITIPETATAENYFFLRLLDLDKDNTTSEKNEPYGFMGLQNGNVYMQEKASDWDAEWLLADNYKRTVTYTNGETFNITARLDLTSGNINYYMDGVYFYTQRNTSNAAFGRWYGILALGLTDEGKKVVPEVDVVYSIGVEDRNEIPVISKTVDETNKKISIEFTEQLTANNINATKLYKVNGKTEVTVTQARVSGKTVEIFYDGTLTGGCEYMVELPEDIAGTAFTSGGVNYQYKPASNMIYFTTEDAINRKKDYTFEDSVENTLTCSNGYGFSLGDGSGMGGTDGLVISLPGEGVTYGTSDYFKWSGGHGMDATLRNNDVQVLSLDIKKVNTDLVSVFEVGELDDNRSIFFGINNQNQIFGCYGYCDFGRVTDLDGNNSWWGGYTKLGTYTPGSWVNIKLEWDKNEKKGQFYIDGVRANSKNSRAYDTSNWIGTLDMIPDFKGFNGLGIRTYTSKVSGSYTLSADGLMIIDNFKTYGINKSATVKSVSFKDENGNTFGSYDTLDNPLDSVAVTFGQPMSLTNAKSDYIKLYYGNEELDYTAVYDATTATYTMTPAEVSAYVSGANYRVVAADGLTSSTAAEIGAYESCIYPNFGAFYNVNLQVVDDVSSEPAETIVPGEAYTIKHSLNTDVADTSIAVIVAERYSDGRLAKVVFNNITETSDSTAYSMNADADEYPTSVAIYAWRDKDGMKPICSSLTIPVFQQ